MSENPEPPLKGLTLELQERIAQLREAVLNAKDEVLTLREENQHLKAKLSEQTTWQDRAARYVLVAAPGGAMVYRTDGPPPHYACPRCFEERKVHYLQDRGVMSGAFDCPGCGKAFDVGTPNYPPSRALEPDF